MDAQIEYNKIENNLLDISEYLKELGSAFKITGNDLMYNNLKNIVYDIKENVRILQEVTLKELNERVDNMHKNSAAILEACLKTGNKNDND